MEHRSLDEADFLKQHPWCMWPQWDEARSGTIPCGKQAVAVLSMKNNLGITEWDDTENWRTVCAEHYAEFHKP
jgi:hypothetical protein